jgi:hypothetical protein
MAGGALRTRDNAFPLPHACPRPLGEPRPDRNSKPLSCAPHEASLVRMEESPTHQKKTKRHRSPNTNKPIGHMILPPTAVRVVVQRPAEGVEDFAF